MVFLFAFSLRKKIPFPLSNNILLKTEGDDRGEMKKVPLSQGEVFDKRI